MIRPLALILALLWPALVQAETVVVSSGEHAGFSRIVLRMQAEPNWRFGKVDGGYEFRAGRPDVTYDLATVFNLIPRARISDLRDLGDGRLFFAIDCDCHSDAFVFRSGEIVLDIINGTAPTADWPFEARLDAETPAPEPDPQVATAEPAAEPAQPASPEAPEPAAQPTEPATPAAEPVPAPPPDTAQPHVMMPPPATEPAPQPVMPVQDRGGLPLTTASRESEAGLHFGPLRELVPSATPDSGSESPAITAANNQRVQDTQTALLEQIARAAAQGLLDADMGRIEAGVAQATRTPAPSAEPEAPYATLPITEDGHISVETGADRAAAAAGQRIGKTDDGTACLDPSLFDAASWGEPLDEGINFGAHRAQIVGEFDQPQPEGMTDLTRYYIYLSFGAEARALIQRYPDVVQHPAVLYVMADVMDNKEAAAAPSLVKQMACSGATALWATLAQPKLLPSQSINKPAVTLTFSALPAHLRRHLGPRLAEKFLAMGDQETADIIRRAFGRAVAPDDTSLELVNAEFDVADGRVDSALNRLDTVVANDDSNLPEALLRRVNTTLDSGAAVPEQTLTLLESLVFELRGTEIGAQLVDANIRARGSVRYYETAFNLLRDAVAQGEVSDARAVELRQILFGQLAKNSSDASFLRRISGHMDQVVKMPAANRREIAQRFLDLNLPDPARQVLAGTGASVPDEADRLLYALAALLDSRPDVAIGYLAGLHGDEAESLRAQALAHAGDYAAATTKYESLGNTEAALHNAWRGGLWPDVVRLDSTGPEGQAASLMDGSAPIPVDPLPTTPLAKSEALIQNSEAVRQTLDALLNNIEPLSSQ